MKRPLLALAALGLLAAPLAAHAQSLEVLVVDQRSNAPLAGQAVHVENSATGYRASAPTSAFGKVRFPALSTAGLYRVFVDDGSEYFGLSTQPLSLRSGADRSVTLALVPRRGVVAGTEAVAARSGTAVAELNTVNAEVSSTLREREVEEMPIEGRDITRVLYRLPNVVPATGFYPEAPNVSINGANSLFTSYLLDGLDNNENFLGGQKFAVPTGFAREITALTNNYSTEYGRTGNGVINVTTRSGGNAFSGEAFWVNRPGPALDASSPFAQRDLSGNQVKDGFKRNQGGLALGGPIVRDQTFFFLDAEYTRDAKDNLLTSPSLGVNTIVPGNNEFLYLSGKLTHRLGQGLDLSLRGNFGQVSIERQGGGLDGGVTFPTAGSVQDRDSGHVAATATWIHGPLASETGVQWSRFRWNYAQPLGTGGPDVTVLDSHGLTAAVLGHPGYVFDSHESTWQLQQKVSMTLERHTLKAGVEFLSAGFSLAGGGNPAGSYLVQLSPQEEALLLSRGVGAGLAPGDIPPTVRVLEYDVELRPATFGQRQNITSLYAEDVFTATSRLTVSAGLRWDYDSLSVGGGTQGDGNNFAPRLNVNYQLGDRSVVRFGYGIFYDKILYAITSDALQQGTTSTAFQGQLSRLIALGILPATTDFSRVIFDGNLPATLTQGVHYLQGPPASQLQAQRDTVLSNDRRILNPDGYQNPYTHQISLGYQNQIGKDLLFYVDLLHTRSENLFRLRDLNAPSPYPIDPGHVVVRTPVQADATRPAGVVAGGARNIMMTETAGRARYYAASLNLVKDKGSDPWAFRLSYTLSRLENDTEDINFRAMDANDFAAEWGPSINDRTHVISALVSVYPVRGLSVALAALVQSGQPVNRIPDAAVYGTTDLNGDGRSFSDSYTGNSDRQPGESRNSDRLPWSRTFDLAAQYRLPFPGEHVEIRADVFNLFNHVNLSGFSNNATQSNQIQVGPPSAGIVARNAGAPRQFQFGVRYVF